MSNEERQRTLREAGHRPAQAEKEARAKESKETLGREESELAAEQREAPDNPSPVPEDDPDRPTPRR
jgi:hypothetical protein